MKKDAVDDLVKHQKFYHKYSHPTWLTLAAGVSFSEKGFYVGASFDEGKISAYTKEVNTRVSLAKVFPNFIDGVKVNLNQW